MWSTDAGLTGVLVFMILYIIASHVLDRYHFFKLLSLIFLSLFFLSAVLSVDQRSTARRVLSGFALLSFGFIWIDYFFPEMGFRTLRILAGMMTMAYLALVLLRHVFFKGTITYHRICGAIAVYLLMASLWTDLYIFILRFNAGAFKLAPEVIHGPYELLQATMFYFSVVTMTTLGYGDIVALSPGARLVVLLEALFGQLYPAIMLAWLVSMEIVSRTTHKG
jgi:voltage-gated potassium channel Kch